MDTSSRFARAATLFAALTLLDVSLTFQNVWPTPMVRWEGELSIELAIVLLAIAAATSRFGRLSNRVLRLLGLAWVVAVIGHYADVSAEGLYGREVNLYWDLRFIPDVTALFVRAAPLWLVVVSVAVSAGVLLLMYIVLRWALKRVADASAGERRFVAALGAALVCLFVVDAIARRSVLGQFSAPVIATAARQTRLVAQALTGRTSLPPSPGFESDLARVNGADVFLIFLESYGAVTFDRPQFATRLAGDRARFETAVRETKRDVVSAFVESPTFGGSSWLAHISLMSGIEVRGPDTNALLMTQKRPTLVTTFSHRGYRTIALMPALWQLWPEGAFYNFDEIYGGRRLDYHGPQFGWFDMNDQFALARLDMVETSRAPRRPLFVFFPTITTHTPFSPTPPYQPDWTRVLSGHPYDSGELKRAYIRQPDWLNLGPSYMDAMSYAYTTLSGYLRQRAASDFVMIVLGDHQPPALVSGEGAPWDVPVHVITNRGAVLERLRAHGFRSGIVPARPGLGRMHTLLPIVLDAFGEHQGE